MLKLAKSFSGDATDLATTIKEEAKAQAEQADPADISYDAFLGKLGLTERQDDLADYLGAGKEITELKQMDEQDLIDDILNDGDLGLNGDQKTAFQAAEAELRQPCDAAAAAEKHEEKNPKWESLLELLGALEDKQLQLQKGNAQQQLGQIRSRRRGGRLKSVAKGVRIANMLVQKSPEKVS